MKKKRIGVIGLKGLPAFGGASTVGENIIEQLKDKYEFTVYSVSSHTNHKERMYNGYRQIVFKRIPNLRLNTLYYYILSAFHAVFLAKYDLIHLHHRDAAFIMLLLRLRYKVICTTHGTFGTRPKWRKYDWFFAIQVKYFLKLANIITCVSFNEKRMIKKNLNLDVNYIPNGINRVDFNSVDEINDKDYLFFGAGRIIRTKGCEIMLQAFNKMDYKGKIIVAGDLEQTPDYKKEILDLSENLHVEFPGLIKEKEKLLGYLKNASLFIFPSNREAMSIMLLEGASMKVPCVCSDIIENTDVFNEDEVLFFKTDNVDDLIEKIKWAFDNPIKMKEKAERAYSKLLDEYIWSKIAAQYSVLFEQLLNRKK